MSTTKLEAEARDACSNFECGLASDNVEEASKLIGEGEATLKISIFPWGPEFEVVPNGSARRKGGGEAENGM